MYFSPPSLLYDQELCGFTQSEQPNGPFNSVYSSFRFFISLCKGRRGQQSHAQVQGPSNGMPRMGRVGGAYDPTVISLGACFCESIRLCRSTVVETTVELCSKIRLTLNLRPGLKTIKLV